ncbi:MAG: heparinase II/III family protein, partial [Candidatus Hydrogenedentes bacterium]|nr:heparinase II/III family protein [Candidatus Hydrogenedentota bacterium]
MKFSNALHSLMKVLLPSLAALFVATAGAQDLLKDHSVLYPESVAAAVRANVANDPWAASVRDRVVAAATFWHDKSDAELWELMFGPTLERSWMVWSNGYSPVTGKPVPMYNWVVDAQNHPWKTQDPTSGEWFPKNDFKAFYDSGLDERGLFAAQRADRSLLFNTDHPDPGDPQHLFGVDDGLGYVNEKGERWRFIGAYLIYGQWKQLVVAGVRVLSAAYLLTGDPAYAHKAGVLLDRIADLYPDFDFKTQGILYEGPASAGYVSTWHDTCEETRELIMGYDMVFEALRNDAELVAFLSKRAAEIHLENPKASFVDIQRHIEGRILRDALAHPDKIHSNYPRSEILKAVTTAVLQEPEGAFWALVDPMLQQTTAVDGVTGEKGLAGYSSFTISALASFLSEFSKADPGFVARMLERCPELKKTYRFFIDTLCLQRYYPQIGDSGHYAAVMDSYVGIDFLKPGENIQGWGNWTLLCPSNYRFLWKLYELTNDPAYVQVLYWANGNKVDGLPYDIYGADHQQFRDSVAAVIEREGAHIALGSVNKQAWHLAILRSGRGANERALWLDYDAGGGHGHQDGMNLGLFAFGLDLSPEMGYPPVQFGGWGSPRARWYTMTAAHNTVVVDRVDQKNGAGETTLWLDASRVHAIRARGSAMIDGE